ncbi:MAG TPA: ScyD/ScyE family protein [Pyrinomonadaceae bacterium]
MKKIKLLSIFITGCLLLAGTTHILGQAASVFTTGLQAPTKIITAGESHLLVAETGTGAPNTSRISMVDRTTGARQTLIDGLPSAFNTVEQSPSGASGIKLAGLKLYLTFGQGDSVISGRRGGTVANPNPATPLNNSILELTLPADYEALAGNFSLSLNNQTALAGGSQVILQNSEGKFLTVRLVANLPDYATENLPFLPQGNVRPANVFGIEMANGSLYVIDASFNQLYKVNPATGEYSTFAVFPPKPNPLPFGPPFSEAVPNNVRLFGNQLLVSFLTGFPFATGNAEIQSVDLTNGSRQVFRGNLTSAMDILPVPLTNNNHSFYVLEFSANMLGNPPPPGKLKLITSAGETVVSSSLISPTSVARDGDTGDLFVTEIFTGRIIRISATISQ